MPYAQTPARTPGPHSFKECSKPGGSHEVLGLLLRQRLRHRLAAAVARAPSSRLGRIMGLFGCQQHQHGSQYAKAAHTPRSIHCHNQELLCEP
jgi:hypothetical protein